VVRRFDASAQSVPRARAFVADALDGVPVDVRSRALLATSELTSNAIVHARSSFTVVIAVHHDHVRIEVRDDSDAPAVRKPTPRDRIGHNGLNLVGGLARAWGWRGLADGGKVVWCELER
jgi:anti-sigma regulatory factor (Ser/Thr protein kinase)